MVNFTIICNVVLTPSKIICHFENSQLIFTWHMTASMCVKFHCHTISSLENTRVGHFCPPSPIKYVTPDTPNKIGLMKASLSWETFCTYSLDNTISMSGKNKSLLKLIKDAHSEFPQKIFDVGCLCHLAHLCAQKGAKTLSMQVDDFVIDLFYHFKRSMKRKATLRD